MVYRIFVQKKKEFASEANLLCEDIRSLLSIDGLEELSVINRYDVEGIDKELFMRCVNTVFCEPQTDEASFEFLTNDYCFATEYLPGQYDQRADSAAQCIQIISCGERPNVRTAKLYVLKGRLSEDDIKAIKKYVINPVEAREATLEKFDTIKSVYQIPETVATLDGFCEITEPQSFIDKYGLAMDCDDLAFCIDYFKKENRNPTITELKMIDTYWSDHCRHTTFGTVIDDVQFSDERTKNAYMRYLQAREETNTKKSPCLMGVATAAVKLLKKRGLLAKLDESEEINACTIKIKVDVNGVDEDWLLLFKNETHNHPTEIEPFGGAATCIGGAIRDPLSGRSYVYAAMRVTGAANPKTPVNETIEGKLPQRKIVISAANGYSSYGNQIGLATGIVEEIYHSGYAAKRMEIGAVLGATPAENVRRECPVAGDVILLLGGKTGRDGCGGATGSSKSHTLASLESCGAEVQKGNAPEERKLQRLFSNPKASKLIKRCNDFGAGGVSVAIGELADGVSIDLNQVPKKYEGLDGTELAISESQERMAVVVAKEDAERFIALADSENLQTARVAVVTEEPRLVMSWNGTKIVDISREFLNSNGAPKHIDIITPAPKEYKKAVGDSFENEYVKAASSLNGCSKRGLSERFDSTIGAATVLMPFGGRKQLTPIQAMVHKLPVRNGETTTCSYMSWGYDPFISEQDPYAGAYLAVFESVAKLCATGADLKDTWLTLQEYFEKPLRDSKRWGKPLAALLGAFDAQLDLGIAAIGGKDSMSGSFEQISVPPTLVSFAVANGNIDCVCSPEFKKAGDKVFLLEPEYTNDGLPKPESFKKVCALVHSLIENGNAKAVFTTSQGGIASGVMRSCFGNDLGFDFADGYTLCQLFDSKRCAFVIESDKECGQLLGYVTDKKKITREGEIIDTDKLLSLYENGLESVFRCNITQSGNAPKITYTAQSYPTPREKIAKPKVLIPVFPGTNCEYDSAKAVTRAGGIPEVFVVNNQSREKISDSVVEFAKKVKDSQIIFIPGGFSGGDEPDGSGKFITAFFRSEAIKEQTEALLESRDGLICGICNGFQALIKLGLVPFGRITEPSADTPTLTFNVINRHQSRLVRTRIASNKSPWLMKADVNEIYTVPISHGEGRFICDEATAKKLIENGQVATQYVNESGDPSMDIHYNPNGSYLAIEGITSPDGRVFGKMGHTERTGNGLYKNVFGNTDMKFFESAVAYFAE